MENFPSNWNEADLKLFAQGWKEQNDTGTSSTSCTTMMHPLTNPNQIMEKMNACMERYVP